MTIRHLKKYLFFSVTAIKMMYFLAFIKEFETHISSSSVTFGLSSLIYNAIKVTRSSDDRVITKIFQILSSLSTKRMTPVLHKKVLDLTINACFINLFPMPDQCNKTPTRLHFTYMVPSLCGHDPMDSRT